MKINQQYQSLHTPGESAVDWEIIQRVEADICLFYHQQSDYSYIMGDLYYGDVYSLEYWNYLNLDGLEEKKQEFIRDGCLVIIFAMLTEVLDGTGCYIKIEKSRYRAAKENVSKITSDKAETNRLIEILKLAFRLAEEERGTWDESPEAEEINDALTWVHEIFVRSYFEEIVREFRENPYFNKRGA